MNVTLFLFVSFAFHLSRLSSLPSLSRSSLFFCSPTLSPLSSQLSHVSLHSPVYVSYLSPHSPIYLSYLSLALSVLTALTYPARQSAWALAHSLIGELLVPTGQKLSKCTWSDLVPLERSVPVPALELEMCLCVLWCRLCLCLCVCVSVSVSGGVLWLLSSLRCCLSVVVWWIVVDAMSAAP